MAKKKTEVSKASEPAKAGDIGVLLKAMKCLKDHLADKNWWHAWEDVQTIFAEIQAGTQDNPLFMAENPTVKGCCEQIDQCCEELEAHDGKAAKAPAPAMAGGLWITLLPVVLQAIQLIMQNLKKKE
jgi:hypothetical protein